MVQVYLIIFYENNKYIAINGAPETDKSTLLNYIISNLLIRSLLRQYKIPRIFFIGLTKNAVRRHRFINLLTIN